MFQFIAMRLLVLGSFIFIAFLGQVAAQDDRWDLQRCIEYGMKNNINVRQARLQAEQSKISYDQSKLQQLPTLGYGASHGFSFGRTLDRTTNVYTSRAAMFEQMNLQSNALLFNFNGRKNTVDANKYSLMADEATIEKTANDIAIQLKLNL